MSKINVAIVDDNEKVVNLLIDVLKEDIDIEVVGKANNGIDALDMIKEKKPDIILLDLVMPRLDGLSVLEKINNDNGLNKTPCVIVISAMVQEGVIDNAFELGASYYIMKPFDNENLISKIKKLNVEGYNERNNNEKVSVPCKSISIMSKRISNEEQLDILFRKLKIKVFNNHPLRKVILRAVEIDVRNVDSISGTIYNIYKEIACERNQTTKEVINVIQRSLQNIGVYYTSNTTLEPNTVPGWIGGYHYEESGERNVSESAINCMAFLFNNGVIEDYFYDIHDLNYLYNYSDKKFIFMVAKKIKQGKVEKFLIENGYVNS